MGSNARTGRVAVVVGCAWFAAACGSSSAAERDTQGYDTRLIEGPAASQLWGCKVCTAEELDMFRARVRLEDGRRVALYYDSGRGVFEQHSGVGERLWTRPRLVHRSARHPCQGIELEARGDTVAATFDFATYCYEGSAPMESIAAVTTGDLRTWRTKVVREFDGFSKVRIDGDGNVRWTRDRRASLRWTPGDGFGRVRRERS